MTVRVLKSLYHSTENIPSDFLLRHSQLLATFQFKSQDVEIGLHAGTLKRKSGQAPMVVEGAVLILRFELHQWTEYPLTMAPY